MRDVYAHRPVDPGELPSLMRKHIYTGAMAMVCYTLVAHMFFVDYGNRIGLSYWHWGLLNGVAAMTVVLPAPVAIFNASRVSAGLACSFAP